MLSPIYNNLLFCTAQENKIENMSQASAIKRLFSQSSSLFFGTLVHFFGLNSFSWTSFVGVELGSVCKVRTQDPENFDEEVKSLVTAWHSHESISRLLRQA